MLVTYKVKTKGKKDFYKVKSKMKIHMFVTYKVKSNRKKDSDICDLQNEKEKE